jgi:hypothetical protein
MDATTGRFRPLTLHAGVAVDARIRRSGRQQQIPNQRASVEPLDVSYCYSPEITSLMRGEQGKARPQ